MTSALDFMKNAAQGVTEPDPDPPAEQVETPAPNPPKAPDVTANPFETAPNPFAKIETTQAPAEQPAEDAVAPSTDGFSALFGDNAPAPAEEPAAFADLFAAPEAGSPQPAPAAPADATAVPPSAVSDLFGAAKAEKEQKPVPAKTPAPAQEPKGAKPQGLDAASSDTVRRLAKDMGLGEMDVIAAAIALLDATRSALR